MGNNGFIELLKNFDKENLNRLILLIVLDNFFLTKGGVTFLYGVN